MRYTQILPAWFHLSFASTAEAFVSRWKAGVDGQDRPGMLKWPTSYSDNIGSAKRTRAITESLLENQWRAATDGKTTNPDQENVVHSSRLTSLRYINLFLTTRK